MSTNLVITTLSPTLHNWKAYKINTEYIYHFLFINDQIQA